MFSRDTKDEVARVPFERGCCHATFVRAMVAFAAAKPPPEDITRDVLMSSERGPVARTILHAAHAANMKAHLEHPPAHRNGMRFRIRIPRADLPPHGIAEPPARLCCRRAFLRAAFLACGSVSDPTSGYHVEFYCPHAPAARVLRKLLASLNVDTKTARRRNRTLIYMKDAESLSMLLGHMGANRAVLALAAHRALRQTKNSIQRAVNSEAANAARTAVSATRQRKAAMRVIRRLGLARISPALREAAKLRIAYPARSLQELADAAKPPITKAAMANRLRLLESLAQR